MFRRIVFSAVIAGFIAGVVLSTVQQFQVVPLILQAESYETAAVPTDSVAASHCHGDICHSHAEGLAAGLHESLINQHHCHGDANCHSHDNGIATHQHANAHNHDGHGHRHNHDGSAHTAWAPADGWERTAYTVLMNVVTAIGFALLLGAIFSLRQKMDWRQGLLWGLGGFAVFFALPSLGLAPELPGAAAAHLDARQAWWLLTIAGSALGLGLLLLQSNWLLKIVGAVALIAPHIIGAPHSEVAGSVPPELAQAFIIATAIANVVFWAVLGAVNGFLFRKLA